MKGCFSVRLSQIFATGCSNHITSLPQRALHTDKNGGQGKFEVVILLASFERQKTK